MGTLREVNRRLHLRGREERLTRGRGYYYFRGAATSLWPETMVMVNRADDLTVDQWLEEFDRLRRAHEER